MPLKPTTNHGVAANRQGGHSAPPLIITGCGNLSSFSYYVSELLDSVSLGTSLSLSRDES
jgi:hypothetical protein